MTPLLPAQTLSGVDRIHHADALRLLRSLPDNSVRMVFIDPPYGNNNGVDDLAAARARNKVKGGRQRGTIEAIANDGRGEWRNLMIAVLPQVFRVLKNDGAVCCCVGGGGADDSEEMSSYAELDMLMRRYGRFDHAVVWDKSKRGNGMGWRYRRNYEFVMVGHKRGGKLSWNESRGARPNVVYHAPTKNQHHPTEKPVSLVEEFILNHTVEGDTVLDCFCGSGTTGVSAAQHNRRYILADLAGHHVAKSRKRIADGITADMFAASA